VFEVVEEQVEVEVEVEVEAEAGAAFIGCDFLSPRLDRARSSSRGRIGGKLADAHVSVVFPGKR
jgi:hypothetical protein